MPDYVTNLRGQRRRADEPTRIFLHEGVGILGPHREHLHGGQHHVVPYAFALELVGSNRAHFAPEEPEPAVPAVEQRDPQPVHQEPQPRRKR